MKATLHKGGSFSDSRGTLRFVNEQFPGNYRRFYLMTHPETTIVRAWQGHLNEEKAFFTITGNFMIATVNPECFETPADDEKPDFFELDSKNNSFLRVPGGNYTGIKALVPNSTLLVLSSLELALSKEDDYRQPADKWVDWNSLF